MKYFTPSYLMPALTVLLCGLIAALWLADIPTLSKQPALPQPAPTPLTSQLEVTGQVVCLPHKNSDGPHTLECAYGLQADSGEHYGLRHLDRANLINATIMTGQRYKVVGTSSAPSEDERYDVVGNISVTAIDLIE